MTPPTRRLVILRTSRDTLVLIVCAVGVTLAMAYSVRQRPAPVADAAAPPAQVWAGQLADLSAEPPPPEKPEAMTSASLVVPEAAMALPAPQGSAARSSKSPACDGPACRAAPLPPARQKLAAVEADKSAATHGPKVAPKGREKERRFGFADLNPLPHLPDAVRKPFSYAGAKLSGLIDWF